jgi:ribonuclease HI
VLGVFVAIMEAMERDEAVVIYTDGACIGNPGPGGYGVVILSHEGRLEFSGGCLLTTNNRMEIMAAIVGLEAVRDKTRVTLYSDSQYLVKAMRQGWVLRWRANGWRRNRRDKALNPDLWQKLLALCERREIEFRWVRGHARTPENLRCDELALRAAREPDLPLDDGYLAQRKATEPML